MKWEVFEKQMAVKPLHYEQRTQVDVECPVCGRKLWRRNDIVLTTYPPKYRYECDCGWWGSAFN